MNDDIFVTWTADGFGKCPACSEDELEGGQCKYCGHTLSADEIKDAEVIAATEGGK